VRKRLRSSLVPALVCLVLSPTAAASELETSLARFPDYARVTSHFVIEAPECVPDEYGWYPDACWEADLLFRVARRRGTRWVGVYRDLTPVYTDGVDNLSGTHRTRLSYFQFRGYSWSRRVCRRYRVKMTLVDSFASTRDPTRVHFWRACHSG
jgi:cellulose synthase/poly-beta-1,6-N-acetylglucosamine synthase-like glycosyltransferase